MNDSNDIWPKIKTSQRNTFRLSSVELICLEKLPSDPDCSLRALGGRVPS